MREHTPGPWRQTTGRLVRVVSQETKDTVCGVHRIGEHNGRRRQGEVEANAALIAAAPIGYELALTVIELMVDCPPRVVDLARAFWAQAKSIEAKDEQKTRARE